MVLPLSITIISVSVFPGAEEGVARQLIAGGRAHLISMNHSTLYKARFQTSTHR